MKRLIARLISFSLITAFVVDPAWTESSFHSYHEPGSILFADQALSPKTIYFPSIGGLSEQIKKILHQGVNVARWSKSGYEPLGAGIAAIGVAGFAVPVLRATWEGSRTLILAGSATALGFLGAGIISFIAFRNRSKRWRRGPRRMIIRILLTLMIPLLVAGHWRYRSGGVTIFHDARRAVGAAMRLVDPQAVLPGPWEVQSRNDIIHYAVRGWFDRYDIVRIPLADGNYHIRMQTYDPARKQGSIKDYLRQAGAVAGLTANYPRRNVFNLQTRKTQFDPAGLVISGNHIMSPFEIGMRSDVPQIGEAILALTQNGKTILVRSPESQNEIQQMTVQWKEAVQLGPILIWPDVAGQGRVAPNLPDYIASSWAFIALDEQDHLYLGLDHANSWGATGSRTHRDIALQIVAWAQEQKIHIVKAVSADGGGYASLMTHGLLEPDLAIESLYQSHPSVLMVVKNGETVSVKGEDKSVVIPMPHAFGWFLSWAGAVFLLMAGIFEQRGKWRKLARLVSEQA
jgi:hypothetical protein